MTSNNTKNPAITISPALDSDLPDFWTAMSRGFEHDAPFVDIYFPAHDTEAGREAGVKRLLPWKQSSPNTTMLKAVLKDEDSGEEVIVGAATWTHMVEPPPVEIEKMEDVESVWPDPQDAEYMRRLWARYARYRRRAVEEAGERGIYVLELLSVDKRYHRQGAGLALVEWGTSKADEKGLEAVVEATRIGRRTYEKAGFVVETDHMDLDCGEEFANRLDPNLLFLRRSARR